MQTGSIVVINAPGSVFDGEVGEVSTTASGSGLGSIEIKLEDGGKTCFQPELLIEIKADEVENYRARRVEKLEQLASHRRHTDAIAVLWANATRRIATPGGQPGDYTDYDSGWQTDRPSQADFLAFGAATFNTKGELRIEPQDCATWDCDRHFAASAGAFTRGDMVEAYFYRALGEVGLMRAADAQRQLEAQEKTDGLE